jgi:hypothetical protein
VAESPTRLIHNWSPVLGREREEKILMPIDYYEIALKGSSDDGVITQLVE